MRQCSFLTHIVLRSSGRAGSAASVAVEGKPMGQATGQAAVPIGTRAASAGTSEAPAGTVPFVGHSANKPKMSRILS